MAGKTAKKSSPRSAATDPKRRIIVFSSLAASLAVTGVFLHLLSPPPVRTQVQGTVLMGDPIERASLNAQPALRQWKSIYIHQSKTAYADAQAVGEGQGDHFVIANGSGAGDGELLISSRWKQQRPAVAPTGASSIAADCICISMIGDFDHAKPTGAQVARLAELINSLRLTHNIPAPAVYASAHPTPAGLGKLFPMADLRRQLKP